MNEQRNPRLPDDRATAETASEGKRQYQKPSFQCEKVFETMALSCGKLSATQAQCRFNKKTS
jgi:hypothetical protein